MDPGDQAFQIYPTPIGNIGLHICYDCNFPESARVMALLGADILALPTNWPEGRDKVAKYVVNTRAYENKVHLLLNVLIFGMTRIIQTKKAPATAKIQRFQCPFRPIILLNPGTQFWRYSKYCALTVVLIQQLVNLKNGIFLRRNKPS